MEHYGDITKISGYDVPIVDCVTFGAPCQDLSVAGKRKGMKHEDMGDDETTRSGLFHEAIRIIKEMRTKDESNGRSGESIRPRFAVYENVPGAFSSNKGEDFKIVLEEIAKVIDKDATIPMPDKWSTSGCIMGDGWSIAWRVFDAQFWGVPQRRRRIALVADFGGQCASEILFVKGSLSGDSSQSRKPRQTASADAKGCVGADDCERRTIPHTLKIRSGCEGGGKGALVQEDLSATLSTKNDQYLFQPVSSCGFPLGFRPENVRLYDEKATTLCVGTRAGFCNGVVMNAVGLDCYNQSSTGDVAKALTNRATDSDHVPCVVMDRSAYNQGVNAKFDIGIDENGKAFSCLAKGPGAVAYEQPVICLQGNGIDRETNMNGSGIREDKAFTLNTIDRHGVALGEPYYIVRRLTPTECERLQGYPDGWTDIGEYIDSNGKKKKSSDSARYKALGNSIALPSWKWVLKRLCSHYERDATLASLFDGIGGFPLIWEQLNGKGTTLWASEIEEFPMAVTKVRIG